MMFNYNPPTQCFWDSLSGVGPLVIVADPNALEEVLRAEGKYPMRDKFFTPRTKWFKDQAGIPAGFAQ